MAFKIPLLDSLSLTKGYFHDIPNFRWADVTDKDEIGKGSFGSVMKKKRLWATERRIVTVLLNLSLFHLLSLLLLMFLFDLL